MSILVVEDHPDTREMLCEVISRTWPCACVSTAEEALAAFRRERFELVIADLNLPGMDGAEMIWRMHVMRPGFRLIIASGRPVESRHQWGAVGVFSYLLKPYDVDELVRYVGMAMGEHRRRA